MKKSEILGFVTAADHILISTPSWIKISKKVQKNQKKSKKVKKVNVTSRVPLAKNVGRRRRLCKTITEMKSQDETATENTQTSVFVKST